VRPTKLVAGAVLTTALALVALPGLSSSRSPSSPTPIDAAALQAIATTANEATDVRIEPLDPDHRSAGFVTADATFVEPGADTEPVAGKPRVEQPGSASISVARPPRYTISGFATFYDHGTTAMRLPRGTLVVICGAGGCLERRVTDYGPNAAMYPERIVDMYRPDFFRICGCGWWSGTTRVTVKVY
jgi:hypothetical protein